MCGISGIFNLNKKPIESADLEKMNNERTLSIGGVDTEENEPNVTIIK